MLVVVSQHLEGIYHRWQTLLVPCPGPLSFSDSVGISGAPLVHFQRLAPTDLQGTALRLLGPLGQ